MSHSINNIHEITIENIWLLNGSLLSLFLAQTPSPTITEIINSQTNENVGNFINSLFAGDSTSHISQMASSSNVKAIVMLPEFAIAKDFWGKMDALVAHTAGSLIIIAGIGYWTELELREWKDASENRDFGFHVSSAFGAPTRTYNCGCCWIRKENGDMRRIVFVKNFIEQQHEATLTPSLVSGEDLLCLRFEDIDVYPLICADVTCNSPPGQKPLERVLENIHEKGGGKKQFIATLAHQKDPAHTLWKRGIATAVRKQVDSESAIMAIANTAACYDSYTCVDEWRNLTGIYVATDLLQTQNEFPAVCCLEGDSEIFGVLARTGEPVVIAGEVSWDFGGGGQRSLWRPRLRSLASDNGVLNCPGEGDPCRDELLHCLCAHCQELSSGSIPDTNQKAALEEIINVIKDTSPPNAKHLHYSMLFGPGRAKENWKTVDRHKLKDKRQQGSKALGALKKSADLEWQFDDKSEGQLKHLETHILIWASPNKYNLTIRRDLETWCIEPTQHAPLLVFADGIGGTFGGGEGLMEVRPDRRSDVTSPPPSKTEKDWTCIKKVRVAHLADLRCFDDCYEEQEYESVVRSLFDKHIAGVRGCNENI